jgi:probable F420-dependent oxidoreductase
MATNGRLQLGLALRFGEVGVPVYRTIGWAELRELAKLAEDVGFDTLFLEDHLIFRDQPDRLPMPEGMSRGVGECFTALAALAEVTRRVTLGPFVACTSFRNPALLAKMADTIDEISGGRFILGLGAGWHEPEYTAFGYPFDRLASRFDEALQIIVPLLREGRVDFEGKYYTARDCELRPRGPRPQGPPIWIGASGPRMLRLVARYADAFNTVWPTQPEPMVERFAAVDAACREVGRDPATLLHTSGAFVAILGREGWTPNQARPSIDAPPDELAARLREFHLAGAQHMNLSLQPFDPDGLKQAGRMIETLRKLGS